VGFNIEKYNRFLENYFDLENRTMGIYDSLANGTSKIGDVYLSLFEISIVEDSMIRTIKNPNEFLKYLDSLVAINDFNDINGSYLDNYYVMLNRLRNKVLRCVKVNCNNSIGNDVYYHDDFNELRQDTLKGKRYLYDKVVSELSTNEDEMVKDASYKLSYMFLLEDGYMDGNYKCFYDGKLQDVVKNDINREAVLHDLGIYIERLANDSNGSKYYSLILDSLNDEYNNMSSREVVRKRE
jgi:hypothetical protein